MPIFAMLLAACAAVCGWLAARSLSSRAQRDTELRLRDADAHLRALVDHSSSAIYLKDRAHRFLMVNRRHMDLWPKRGSFRPGMSASEIFPAEVAKWFTESDNTVWRTGEEYTFEEEVPLADGVHTYVSSKFPVRDAMGRMIALGGISTDVTELKHAREDIARKEQLLRRLIEAQEAEKQRLCHEFHDGLIQYAVGSKMLLESLLEGRLPADEARATIDAVVGHLARGLEDGRRVIRGIRPAALDDLGLAAALQELCAQSWPGGPVIEADIDPAIDGVSDGVQTTVYRIVQESLTNAARHGSADRACVRVRMEGGGLDVEVTDTGRGFNPQATDRQGFGLIGMEERVRLAGGEFRLATAPGAGTRIEARLPLA